MRFLGKRGKIPVAHIIFFRSNPHFLLPQDGVTCLHLSKFCDHQVDCPDNSDEGHQCKQAPSCQKMKCSHSCSISWKGPKCFCPDGLIPAPDDPTECIDLNECEVGRHLHSYC